MYRLPPPPKPISQKVLEMENEHRRNHIHEVVALLACGFVGSALIVYFACEIIALAGRKYGF